MHTSILRTGKTFKSYKTEVCIPNGDVGNEIKPEEKKIYLNLFPIPIPRKSFGGKLSNIQEAIVSSSSSVTLPF